MPLSIRSVLAVLVGISIAIAGVVAVEIFSAVAHPFPADFDASSQEELNEHVARYPAWILAIVVPAWGSIAWIGTWVAKRIAGYWPALVVGLFLVGAVILNISMLPYPFWFKGLSVITVFGAAWLAVRNSNR